MSREHGTYKTLKATFWPELSCKSSSTFQFLPFEIGSGCLHVLHRVEGLRLPAAPRSLVLWGGESWRACSEGSLLPCDRRDTAGTDLVGKEFQFFFNWQ